MRRGDDAITCMGFGEVIVGSAARIALLMPSMAACGHSAHASMVTPSAVVGGAGRPEPAGGLKNAPKPAGGGLTLVQRGSSLHPGGGGGPAAAQVKPFGQAGFDPPASKRAQSVQVSPAFSHVIVPPAATQSFSVVSQLSPNHGSKARGHW
jgi:hypothetical protein